MKPILSVLFLTMILFVSSVAWADDYPEQLYDTQSEFSDELFSEEELDDLLAPIALYPDPLIAQILPAATFVDQIDEAARYVRQYGKSARIDLKNWDVSVKAVAHYPSVLFMMDRRYEWTVSLGQAFVNQEQEVMDAIQRLRDDARIAGSLTSTPQQQVLIEGEIIRIIPAQPEVIYVPQYDPYAVYVESLYPSYGFITFGIGFSIGAWLNRDFDWHRHRIYYHGWRGGGWINRTRPYINVRNRTYINDRHRTITINRRVVQRDTIGFRSQLRRDINLRREQGRVPARSINVPPRRSREMPATSTPRATIPRPSRDITEKRNIYRGRQGSVPGYGSNSELNTYRQRGRMSRDSIRPTSKPPVTTPQRPTGVPRPGQPPRTVTPPAMRQGSPVQAPTTRTAPQPRGGSISTPSTGRGR